MHVNALTDQDCSTLFIIFKALLNSVRMMCVLCVLVTWDSSKHTSSHLLNLSLSTHTHTHTHTAREREYACWFDSWSLHLSFLLRFSTMWKWHKGYTHWSSSTFIKWFITSFSFIKALLWQLKCYLVLCKAWTIFLVFLNDKYLIYCTVLIFFDNKTVILSLVL